MCFFVYAPNSKINIVYGSESITLLKNGKSEVIADLLIYNDSDEDIPQLNIIYPNKFFKFYPIKDSKIRTIKVGEFEDHTETIKGESTYNWAYKDPHDIISFNFSQPSSHRDKELEELVLTQPNLLDPLQTIKYEGYIGGETKITPLDGLTQLQWMILNSFNYTVFSATFNPPIRPKTARWTRWRFKGDSSVVNFKRKREWILRYSNRLHYDYQIMGIYDVKNRLMELLYVLKANIRKVVVHSEVYSDVENLIEFFQTSGLDFYKNGNKKQKITNVEIFDWRLHINPGELDRLTDIVMRGDIEVIGGLPNFISLHNKVVPAYEWKAGPKVTYNPEPTLEFSFNIFFQCKEFHWINTGIFWGSLYLLTIIIFVIIFLFIK